MNNELALTHLKPGERAKVRGFNPSLRADYRKQLQHLGITKQTEITLIRLAPLGDPLQLKIQGSHISLRASEAQQIYIERL